MSWEAVMTERTRWLRQVRKGAVLKRKFRDVRSKVLRATRSFVELRRLPGGRVVRSKWSTVYIYWELERPEKEEAA